MWLTLAQYYTGFLENDALPLIEDLTEFHSASVDPKALTVSLKFYQLIAGEQAFQHCPHLRLHLLTTQYCQDKVMDQGSCVAPVSQFLEHAQVMSFAKKADQVAQIENTIKDLKTKYMPSLVEALGARSAGLEMNKYIVLILRCLFSKPWPSDLEPKLIGLATGKLDQEKILALGKHWAKVVDVAHPAILFAAKVGLQDAATAPDESGGPVDLSSVKGLKRNASCPEGPDPDSLKFKSGDKATVVRRFTLAVPTSEDPDYRKDVNVGTEGLITGWEDAKNRKVLFKVTLKIGEHKKTVTQPVIPRNLKLTSDYLVEKAGQEHAGPGVPGEAEEDEEPAVTKHPKRFHWALQDSDPADVKFEEKWKQLLCDNDKLVKSQYLRARIFTILEALNDVLPVYSEKELIVVNRKNEKGVWTSELHTLKDFGALEIQLAPYSSQLKDSHLMASGNAGLTLPKHGRGAHDGTGMGLDGRCRTKMASKGALDDVAHLGSLYWLVERSTDKTVCNLEYQNATWEMQNTITLPNHAGPGGPAKKRKAEKVVSWSQSELPMVPLLVNIEPVPKHTKLCVFQTTLAKK